MPHIDNQEQEQIQEQIQQEEEQIQQEEEEEGFKEQIKRMNGDFNEILWLTGC